MNYEKKQDVALLRYTAIAIMIITLRSLKKVSPGRTGRSTISIRTPSSGGIPPIKSRASTP